MFFRGNIKYKRVILPNKHPLYQHSPDSVFAPKSVLFLDVSMYDLDTLFRLRDQPSNKALYDAEDYMILHSGEQYELENAL